MNTPDDLDLQSVLAGMAANNITLLEAHTGGDWTGGFGCIGLASPVAASSTRPPVISWTLSPPKFWPPQPCRGGWADARDSAGYEGG